MNLEPKPIVYTLLEVLKPHLNSAIKNSDFIEILRSNKSIEKTLFKATKDVDTKPKTNRCNGLIYALDFKDGNYLPKQCGLPKLGHCEYCLVHSKRIDDKTCYDCSNHYGETITHEFQYQHFGTVESPSYHFTKYHDNLVKLYNKSKDDKLVKRGPGRPKKHFLAKLNPALIYDTDEDEYLVKCSDM
jgi:hypothetical protein